jgi:allantoinase
VDAVSRTAIVGGHVAAETTAGPATVVIDGERVQAVLQAGERVPAVDEVIEAQGLLVLPGAVDPHVHFGDPGQHEREDFDTGTAAALLGGVTTVFEHPLTNPPTTTAERYRDKRESVGRRARVDFGLWGAITPGAVDEIAGQWDAGARGFKAFMCAATGTEYPAADDATLREAMHEIARLGGLVLVHAENDAITRELTERLRAAGRRDAAAHLEARPAVTEIEATARALILAREAGVRVQIVHVSDPDAAALVRAAAARGTRATFEHTANHLLIDSDDFVRIGPWARCAPPLRPRASVERLWDAVCADGDAQLGSDHSPYRHAEKERGTRDIFDAGMGIQGVQEAVPLVLDEALHRRGLDLGECARLIAGNAAHAVGVHPRKGSIRPGADADLSLWDPESEWTVDAARQQRSRNRWSPFDGRRCRMRLVRTILRGRTAARDGEVLAEPGSGRFLVPA